jgi:hypothetical protein
MPTPKPKKVGRPKLPKGEAKGKIVAMRFDLEELKQIDAAAKANKQTRSEWMRNKLNVATQQGYKIASTTLLLLAAVGVSAQHQIRVAIDPRSSGAMESELLTDGLRNVCPNVSIIRDESEAQYVIFANGSCPGFLCHYYVTLYDKQGKVVFETDKHTGKNAIKAFCQFMNGQK